MKIQELADHIHADMVKIKQWMDASDNALSPFVLQNKEYNTAGSTAVETIDRVAVPDGGKDNFQILHDTVGAKYTVQKKGEPVGNVTPAFVGFQEYNVKIKYGLDSDLIDTTSGSLVCGPIHNGDYIVLVFDHFSFMLVRATKDHLSGYTFDGAFWYNLSLNPSFRNTANADGFSYVDGHQIWRTGTPNSAQENDLSVWFDTNSATHNNKIYKCIATGTYNGPNVDTTNTQITYYNDDRVTLDLTEILEELASLRAEVNYLSGNALLEYDLDDYSTTGFGEKNGTLWKYWEQEIGAAPVAGSSILVTKQDPPQGHLWICLQRSGQMVFHDRGTVQIQRAQNGLFGLTKGTAGKGYGNIGITADGTMRLNDYDDMVLATTNSKIEVIDNLTSNEINKALSARQGKILADTLQQRLPAYGANTLLVGNTVAGQAPSQILMNSFLQAPAAQVADQQLMAAPTSKGGVPSLIKLSDADTNSSTDAATTKALHALRVEVIGDPTAMTPHVQQRGSFMHFQFPVMNTSNITKGWIRLLRDIGKSPLKSFDVDMRLNAGVSCRFVLSFRVPESKNVACVGYANSRIKNAINSDPTPSTLKITGIRAYHRRCTGVVNENNQVVELWAYTDISWKGGQIEVVATSEQTSSAYDNEYRGTEWVTTPSVLTVFPAIAEVPSSFRYTHYFDINNDAMGSATTKSVVNLSPVAV